VFFFLAINICYKYYQSERLLEALFSGIVLGALTEVLQQYIPGRNMDLNDGIADTLGVVIGYYVYKSNRSRVDVLIFRGNTLMINVLNRIKRG